MPQAITLTPNTKILLDAMAALQQVPQSTVVEKALFSFRDSLDPEDRDNSFVGAQPDIEKSSTPTRPAHRQAARR